MGSSPSGTFGYGLILPEYSEWKPVDTEWWSKYLTIDDEDYPEDGYVDDDWEMLEDLCKRFPGLKFDTQYVDGWSESAGTVLFAKSTTQNVWDISYVKTHLPTNDERIALGAVAEFLGIPLDCAYAMVVSYG